MRIFIAAIIAIGLVAALVPTNPGDLNNDNVVNILDVSIVTNCLGQSGATCNAGKADPNNDGQINIFDFILVAQDWGKTYNQPPPSTTHPNEPVGFSVVCHHNANNLPPTQSSGLFDTPQNNGNVLAGNWRSNHGSAESDAASPESPPGFWRAVYPSGSYGAVGPITLWCDETQQGTNPEYGELYMSLWYRVGNPVTGLYEGHDTYNKIFFLQVATPQGSAAGNIIVGIYGDGGSAPSLKSTWRPGVHIKGGPITDQMIAAPSRAIIANQWQHWEIYSDSGTVDGHDAVFKWWIDGQLVMNLNNLDLLTATQGYTHGFHAYKWAPTFGGGVRKRTQTDNLEIAHWYISGKP